MEETAKSSSTTSDTVSSAAETFAQEFSSLVNHGEVQQLLILQAEIYQKLHQSSTTLSNFNDLSATTYNTLVKDFEKNTKLLKQMKNDLNLIFKKIRYLKTKIHEKYPETQQLADTADMTFHDITSSSNQLPPQDKTHPTVQYDDL
mmetsp:Transcript_12853/g.17707  ORF Transcript_12853/g.17707 Transcript_12853/m.17707 type:complete len:146 (+) Transcript_12853:54-491(+)